MNSKAFARMYIVLCRLETQKQGTEWQENSLFFVKAALHHLDEFDFAKEHKSPIFGNLSIWINCHLQMSGSLL